MNLKLSRERLILVGLLGTAGVALLFDQVIFAKAPADVASEYSVATSIAAAQSDAASSKAKPAGIASSAERILAERLTVLAADAARSGPLRDVFNEHKSSPPEVSVSADNSAWSKRTLNGVLFGADGKGIAIVDGRMIKLGARLDGLRLVRVSPKMAVFGDGDAEIILRISQKSSPPN